MTRRIIATGPPGGGKTTTLELLRGRGFAVIDEAATDVNDELLAAGVERPHEQPDFLARIVALQRARRLAATGDPQLHDRSAFCTLALARYLGLSIPDALLTELDATRDWFEADVLFFEPLGFVTRTAVRRISYADSLVFGDLHRQVYLEFGFSIVDIPAGPAAERAPLIEGLVSSLS